MANLRLCSISECGKKHYARGWCSPHYQRWLIHGDPLLGGVPRSRYGEICIIDGCDNPEQARGWCSKHYKRWEKTGTTRRAAGTPRTYYEEVVLEYEGDDCLIWPFSRYKTGYGQISIGDKMGTVHRFLCIATHGNPPSPEFVAAHSCGKGQLGCVARSHLSWKTMKENQADRLTHGTDTRGEKSKQAKLTDESVRAIRAAKGVTQLQLAEMYGVSRPHIGRVKRGTSWPGVP